MTYIIKTYDDKEYQLDNQDALDLIEAWMGSERAFPVDLGGQAINSGNIKSIEPRKLTEADLPRKTESMYQLEAGTRCRGQYSVQNEINKLALASSKEWSKKIRSSQWRETVRKRLTTGDDQWCDYKTGLCNCDADFISYKQRHGFTSKISK